MKTIARGIDVSTHNKDIDWKAVSNDGVQFAMIRAGFGRELSQKDKYFDQNMEGALDAGLQVGVYWFSYAYTVEGAKEEARTCLQVIKPYQNKITYPVCFDWEYDSDRYAQKNGVTPDRQLITDMAVAFLEEVKAAGYKVANYTNLDYLRNKFDTGRMGNYDLWLAHYTDGEPACECALHQTGSTGTVDGVRGNVDVNVAYKDYGVKQEAAKPHGPSPQIRWDYRYDGQITELQKILVSKGSNLAVDGKAGDKTYAAARKYTIENGDRGPLTRWVQQRLKSMGFHCGTADGIAGSKTMQGIAQFQTANGLGVGYLGGTDWYYVLIG